MEPEIDVYMCGGFFIPVIPEELQEDLDKRCSTICDEITNAIRRVAEKYNIETPSVEYSYTTYHKV